MEIVLEATQSAGNTHTNKTFSHWHLEGLAGGAADRQMGNESGMAYQQKSLVPVLSPRLGGCAGLLEEVYAFVSRRGWGAF